MDVGVDRQKKTRIEAVYVGAGGWHVAHIVVRGYMKLLIRVLLPWVRGYSHTMRVVCWGLKHGNVLRCDIRCVWMHAVSGAAVSA